MSALSTNPRGFQAVPRSLHSITRGLRLGLWRELQSRPLVLLLGPLSLAPLVFPDSRDGWHFFMATTLLPAWALALAWRGDPVADRSWATLGSPAGQHLGRLLFQLLLLLVIASVPLSGGAVLPDHWLIFLLAGWAWAHLGRSAWGGLGIAAGLLAGTMLLGLSVGLSFVVQGWEIEPALPWRVGGLGLVGLVGSTWLEARGGAWAVGLWPRRGRGVVATALVLVLAGGFVEAAVAVERPPSVLDGRGEQALVRLNAVRGALGPTRLLDADGGWHQFLWPWVVDGGLGPGGSRVLDELVPWSGEHRLRVVFASATQVQCELPDGYWTRDYQWLDGGEALVAWGQELQLRIDADGCSSQPLPAPDARPLGDSWAWLDCSNSPRLLRDGSLGTEVLVELEPGVEDVCRYKLFGGGGRLVLLDTHDRVDKTVVEPDGRTWQMPRGSMVLGEDLYQDKAAVLHLDGRRWPKPEGVEWLAVAELKPDSRVEGWSIDGAHLVLSPE